VGRYCTIEFSFSLTKIYINICKYLSIVLEMLPISSPAEVRFNNDGIMIFPGY